MAEIVFDGFIGTAGASTPHVTWAGEFTQNMVMRRLGPSIRGRQGQWSLRGTPGVSRFAWTGRPYPLDLYAFNSEMFAADRYHVYEVPKAGGLLTPIGDVSGDNHPAYFAQNGKLANQLALLTGQKLYIIDLSASPRTVTLVEDDGIPVGARRLSYVDGYFIVSTVDDLLFGLSALIQGFDWSTLDHGRKSTTVDNLKGHIIKGSLLLLFGAFKCEVWFHSGDPSFPYTPADNVIIDCGLAAPDSLLDADGVCFLGQTEHGGYSVMELEGYGARSWSTQELDDDLKRMAETTRIDDAHAFAYADGQTSYYCLRFPTADVTWVGDRTTKRWHKWSFLDTSTGHDAAAIARSHAHCYGKSFVADRRTGVIHTLGGFTDDGGPIRRVRRAPHIDSKLHRVTYSSLRLYLQRGDSPLSGRDEHVDPRARLRYSDNAGRTWSHPRFTHLGERGKYGHIAEWHALGSADIGRQFEVAFTLPEFIGISGAVLDLFEG